MNHVEEEVRGVDSPIRRDNENLGIVQYVPLPRDRIDDAVYDLANSLRAIGYEQIA